ncbi:hypothetical protein FJ960_16235 [Mesorhizobium sp. B2-3-11]|uniref:hypothetical protein n=1 Tax=Mesorhizobium sp. B2-3-11 TaxID=2589953 RepID=UPI00112C87CF|nr:hypothetical protein [Mesorhizobium sp. B2-3-11]TPM02726.1 hypothetical protein FJ960_16235 [Mesorhizobium sp. B2-3-11]
MLVSLERKEEDKSLGPEECKGPNLCFRAFRPGNRHNCASGNSVSVRAAQQTQAAQGIHALSTMNDENARNPAGPCFPPKA